MTVYTSFSLKSIAAACCLWLLAACGSDSEPDQPAKPDEQPSTPPSTEACVTPILSFRTIEVSNVGETIICRVQNPDNLPIECDAEWCQVSLDGSKMKITVLPQSERAPSHTAVIKFIDKNNQEAARLSVTQKPMNRNRDYPVSSTTRSSLFPYFTATWCPFSPDLDKTLEEISARWKKPIIPVKIHVKESSLYTPLSVELSEIYDNNSTPTGYFDNYFVVNNSIDGNVSVDNFWNELMWRTSSDTGYPSDSEYSSLECSAHFAGGNTLEASIHLEPLKTCSYRLVVWVVEDGIIAPQMSADRGEIPVYVHNGVLVASLTPVNGEEFRVSNDNPLEFKFSSAIPEKCNGENVRVIVALQRNDDSLNYSTICWFIDNCISCKPGKTADSSNIEIIHEGDEITY